MVIVVAILVLLPVFRHTVQMQIAVIASGDKNTLITSSSTTVPSVAMSYSDNENCIKGAGSSRGDSGRDSSINNGNGFGSRFDNFAAIAYDKGSGSLINLDLTKTKDIAMQAVLTITPGLTEVLKGMILHLYRASSIFQTEPVALFRMLVALLGMEKGYFTW
jgi:hypothetical protein